MLYPSDGEPMNIRHYYSPRVAGDVSGEAMIFKLGVGQLLDEIRQSILQSQLIISPTATTTKAGSGKTGIQGLAKGLNAGLAVSLQSLGWGPLKAPGAKGATAKLDWYKSLPTGIGYGPERMGIGMEAQFGNNFQFNADLQRLGEAMLEGAIVAGVCVVASDELKNYKADRGAYFSSEKQKLDRHLALLLGSGVARMPGYVMLGIEQDGFGFEDAKPGVFQLKAPVFDPVAGVQGGPVRFETFGRKD
jgi:hypothetical protein